MFKICVKWTLSISSIFLEHISISNKIFGQLNIVTLPSLQCREGTVVIKLSCHIEFKMERVTVQGTFYAQFFFSIIQVILLLNEAHGFPTWYDTLEPHPTSAMNVVKLLPPKVT